MVFSNRANASYAVINNRTKILPKQYNFTIALFVKLFHLNETGTLFSLRKTATGIMFEFGTAVAIDAFISRLILSSRLGERMRRLSLVFSFKIDNLRPREWYHLAWTNLMHPRNRSTDWKVYITPPQGGTLPPKIKRSVGGSNIAEGATLPNRTELYLGQNSPNASNHFDMRFAFLGEISHFNMWNETLTREDVAPWLRMTNTGSAATRWNGPTCATAPAAKRDAQVAFKHSVRIQRCRCADVIYFGKKVSALQGVQSYLLKMSWQASHLQWAEDVLSRDHATLLKMSLQRSPAVIYF
uniref:Pentaxin n=1 Tax=Macrostomum lignano TaxID=282301 RepID=A0A1I8IZB6_9PLAT